MNYFFEISQAKLAIKRIPRLFFLKKNTLGRNFPEKAYPGHERKSPEKEGGEGENPLPGDVFCRCFGERRFGRGQNGCFCASPVFGKHRNGGFVYGKSGSRS